MLVACLPPTPSPTDIPLPSSTVAPTAAPTKSPPPSPTKLSLSPTPEFVLSDQTEALRPAFVADLSLFHDVTRYEIELDIAPGKTALTGRECVDFTNTEDVTLDTLYLRLFPNTPGYGGAMTVTEVLIDRRAVVPIVELEGSALRIPLDPPLEPGDSLRVALNFDLALPDGASQGYRQLGYYEGVLALANAYPIIPVYDDEGWNVEIARPYGDAVYSETAFYTVRLTAPVDWKLIASGTCAVAHSQAEAGVTWDCVTGPMRDFNAVLGADYEVERGVAEGVTINSVFRAGNDEAGKKVLDQAAEAARLFSARFGPYPFTELDVVETPTQAGGIEYPGLVVINASYYESPRERMEWVVVHEVAHQWWYSLVGNDQVDEPWLDEALAQYSTLLYYEDRYGDAVADQLLEDVFRRPYEELQETGRDKAVGLPVAAFSPSDYGSVVYGKGPLYFHELRREVGDEEFWRILQTYFERNRYGIATPEDWLAAVEAVAGDEHRALYEQWIAGP